MWQRNKVHRETKGACKARLSLLLVHISHTIAISPSDASFSYLSRSQSSIDLSLWLSAWKIHVLEMARWFYHSLCRLVALLYGPFKGTSERHMRRDQSENCLRQDKRRQVTSSINCSRLLISQHQLQRCITGEITKENTRTKTSIAAGFLSVGIGATVCHRFGNNH